MSTEYDVSIGVGCVVTQEDLEKPFSKTVPEISHMEDRYSQKTGKKLAPVKVVDQESHDELWFDGELIEDEDESYMLALKMATKIGCCVLRFGNQLTGNFFYLFGPRISEQERTESLSCNLSVGGDLSLEEVGSKTKECKKIHEELMKLGVNPEKPKIVCVYDIL
jgi:hypothetical protein